MKHPTAWRWLVPIALTKFIIAFWLVNPAYDLQRDEFLYYAQGQHPAWGYLENPPLLSWMASIAGWFGGGEFWIRFWPALVGALTVLLGAMLAARLGGGRIAQVLAAVSVITGSFLRTHVLFQPNILDVFSWTLIIYVLAGYFQTGAKKYLYAIGPAVAIGVYSKYSVAFIVIGLLTGILLTPLRRIFLRKEFWISALIGIVLILPNLLWQYNHNWPVLHHMQELRETQLQYTRPGDFLKEQVMMFLPELFVSIAGLIWATRNPKWRFISIAYVVTLALLLFASGKAYYAMGIYPAIFALGAVAFERFTGNKRWLLWVNYFYMLAITILALPMILPIWKPETLAAYYEKMDKHFVWEDLQEHPLPQDFADMLGWRELAEKTEKQWQALPNHIRDSTVIIASGYGQAGALQFYSKDKNMVKQVYSTNGTNLLWMPDTVSFRYVLAVEENPLKPEHPFYSHFNEKILSDTTSTAYARTRGSQIWLMEDPQPGTAELAAGMLGKLKSQFRRD